jgi:hypothetical protein
MDEEKDNKGGDIAFQVDLNAPENKVEGGR